MSYNGQNNRTVYKNTQNKNTQADRRMTAARPVRSPQQENTPEAVKKELTTDEVMRASFIEYQRSQRKKKKMIRTAATILCTVIVLGIIIFAGVSFSSKKDENTAVQTQASAEESSAAAVNSAEPSEETQENNEESLTNPHIYTQNTDRFTQTTLSELDEKITSEFVALYDVTSDEVIYSKNYTKKCYPASTTKLLTAITASRVVKDENTIFTVGNEIKMVGEDSSIARLEEGMQLTFEMIMDALLLPSGNDAAYTIAVNCGRIYKNDKKLSNEKAVKVFMELVNKTAAEIGASHTHFVTPDGWHDDNHYTSAEDLIKIGDYARSIPLIKKSCAKPYAEWKLVKGGTLAWQNSNKLILSDSEVYSQFCDGMKTGFTDQAGTSVVASATMEGHTFIAVVMNGQTLYTKYEDCNLLFEKAFKLYKLKYTTDDE